MQLAVGGSHRALTGAADASGTSQRTLRAARPRLEQVEEALAGQRRLHVRLAAAAQAEDSAHLLAARPRVPLLLQFLQTPLTSRFLQLTLRVVLQKHRQSETHEVLGQGVENYSKKKKQENCNTT